MRAAPMHLSIQASIDSKLNTVEPSPTTATDSLSNSSEGKSLKQYRLYHRREFEKNFAIILQNRVIEAVSAEVALRTAMALLGNADPPVHPGQDSAWATRSFDKFIDYWEAEPD
jgi:hypothetical protein